MAQSTSQKIMLKIIDEIKKCFTEEIKQNDI